MWVIEGTNTLTHSENKKKLEPTGHTHRCSNMVGKYHQKIKKENYSKEKVN
jgi:hypothetical protein